VVTRLEKCIDFDSKRQFLLDYVEKIIHEKNCIYLYGSVPIKLKAYEDSSQPLGASNLRFCIKNKINK
jgi:hypothetical protein